MVRKEVSKYASLAECRIHDALSVIMLESVRLLESPTWDAMVIFTLQVLAA